MSDDLLRFSVRGEPMPQPRPRATMVGRSARIYNPPIADDWRAAVRAAASLAWRRPTTKEMLDVRIAVYLARPQYLRKPSVDPGALAMGVRGKGDADNFAKAILDAMEGVVFENDCQVCRLVVEKYWAARKAVPGAVVRVLGFVGAETGGIFEAAEAGGRA